MNLIVPPNKYFKYEECLGPLAESEHKHSMKRAIEETVLHNDKSRDFATLIDGSWQ